MATLKNIFIAVVLAGLVTTQSVAGGNQVTIQLTCAPTAGVHNMMKRDGYHASGAGVETGGEVTVVWRQGAKWRITTTVNGGAVTCGMTGGDGWRERKPGRAS